MTESQSPAGDATAREGFDGFPGDRDQILSLAEQTAGIGIWYLDLASLMLRGTAQFFRMMGMEPESDTVPLGAVEALRHPDDIHRVRLIYRDAIDSGEDRCEAQFRIVRPDGEIRWILGRGQVVRDRQGRPVRYAGVNVDITASKRAEAARQESEARFRRLFEQSPLGKAVSGADFSLREANPALCDMLGYTQQELVGRNVLDLIHPDDRGASAAGGNGLRNGTLPQFQSEVRYLHKSGVPIWVNVAVAPIRDGDGNVLYYLGIIENIDERKRITQSLQDSERRLRELNERLEQLAEQRARQLASSRAQLQAFFDNSLDWLTLIRATPDGRFVYVDANPSAEIAYGRPHDAIVGQAVEVVLGEDQAQGPMHYLRECMRTGAPQRYVARRTLAGRTTAIDVMFVPVPPHDDSSVRTIITTARDITEREELEAQLRHAQKMEAIGKLTGGVAHDFNNLLAVIAGNAELARRGAPTRVPRMMDNILRASERGVALTRQLLSFSRRQSANPQVLDLRVEVPRVSEMLRASLRGDIRLTTSVADDLWPVEADQAELEIALLNVAANARDAMPAGGSFAIDVRNQPGAGKPSAGPPAGQDSVVITLSDTGSGVARDVLAKVFDPFFTTKGPGEGTGLGLSQVYGFAQQSGGAVAIESEPGQGTQVTLRLPRAHKAIVVARAPEPDKAPARRDERILLVEDNPEVAAVTAQMLGAMGFAVESADRAHKALAILDAGQRFDLLLTDVVMPGGMTGLDLARAVRARFPSLPAILVSGYNDVVGEDGGGFLMLRKPVPFEELSRCVCACLDRAAAGEPSAGAL